MRYKLHAHTLWAHNYLQTLHCCSHLGTWPSLYGPPIVQPKNSLATDREPFGGEQKTGSERPKKKQIVKKNTAKNATRILIMFRYAPWCSIISSDESSRVQPWLFIRPRVNIRYDFTWRSVLSNLFQFLFRVLVWHRPLPPPTISSHYNWRVVNTWVFKMYILYIYISTIHIIYNKYNTYIL